MGITWTRSFSRTAIRTHFVPYVTLRASLTFTIGTTRCLVMASEPLPFFINFAKGVD